MHSPWSSQPIELVRSERAVATLGHTLRVELGRVAERMLRSEDMRPTAVAASTKTFALRQRNVWEAATAEEGEALIYRH